ncbi:MAG TPA: SulP family inorganic anion transporter, partial [Herpetosiphonaceae bacterium]
MTRYAQHMPGLRMLRTYRRSWLRNDLLAGATVFAVLVPSALAYGGLAGLAPVAGLYAALAAMAAYALFGSSRHLIIGPDAALPLILAATIGPLAGGSVERYALLTAGLSMLVGAILIAARVFRVGFLVNFLAQPILTGYLAGVALTVIASQLGRLLGMRLASDTFAGQLWEVARRAGETHLLTFLIGSGSLLTLFAMPRVAPQVPAPLLVMLAATGATAVFDWETRGLAVIGRIPAGLPTLVLPRLSWADWQALLMPSLTIALLSFADAIITARSFAAKYHYEIDANQELVALGAADIAAGLAGGFPISSSSARTAVVTVMGGRTQVA